MRVTKFDVCCWANGDLTTRYPDLGSRSIVQIVQVKTSPRGIQQASAHSGAGHDAESELRESKAAAQPALLVRVRSERQEGTCALASDSIEPRRPALRRRHVTTGWVQRATVYSRRGGCAARCKG